MKEVVFVSLGPGGPECVTLGAVKALVGSDRVICAGRRCSSIVAQIPGVDAAGVEVWDIPMSADASSVYERLAEHVADLWSQGVSIAVTVEGDMSLYSSMHYVHDLLAESGVTTRVIAGVPALNAAAALAGLHLVKHDEWLAVIPGNVTAAELDDMIDDGTAVVVMKVSRCRDAVLEVLLHRKGLKFYYIESVGTPQEYVTSDPADLVDRRFPYFSILLIPSQK